MEAIWLIFGIIVASLFIARFTIKTESKKTESWITISIVFMLSFLFIWGVNNAKQAGPLDDPIINQNDFDVRMDKKVEELQAEGLHTGDAIMFVIPFYKGISQEELQFVYNFSVELSEWFPEYSVLDLRTSTMYRYFDGYMDTAPYLSDEIFSNDWGMEKWKAELDRDAKSKRFMIGGDYDCAIVRLLLPRDYDEAKVFDLLTELLEKKKKGKFHFRTDIELAPEYLTDEGREHVYPLGWVVARGLMTDTTVSDIVLYMTFGIAGVLLVFVFFFISVRQGIVSTTVVTLSFIFVTGTIGLVQYAGMEIYLRIYIILVFSVNIIAGISFSERKYSAYNYIRKQFPELSRVAVWAKTKPINELITLTAIMSFVNFFTLYQIGVVPVWEVGFLSACSILYLWVLTLAFIPAVHIVLGGEKYGKKNKALASIGDWTNSQVERIARFCYNYLDKDQDNVYQQAKAAKQSVTLLIITLIVTLVIVVLNAYGSTEYKRIEVRTRPLEYLNNTIVDRGYEYVKSIGYGFESLNVLVRPKDDSKQAIENADFLKRLAKLQNEIAREDDNAVDVFSVLDAIQVISREDLGVNLPETDQDAYNAFFMLETDLEPSVKEYLWYDGGVVLFVSVLMDDSSKLASLTEQIYLMAKDYPELEVTLFGKTALWPKTDSYIVIRKPVNVLTSFWVVILVTSIWIFIRNRRYCSSGKNLSALKTGLAMSVPFVFASSIMTLAMWVFRVPLDQATACSATLAVSAAADFAIYPIADYHTAIVEGKSRREALRYAILERGEVVVMDVVLNCICFSSLIASSFLPIQRLGWIMVIMLLACGFGAMIMMMSFLPYCVKENKERKSEKIQYIDSPAGKFAC